jgi:hypothetical protein
MLDKFDVNNNFYIVYDLLDWAKTANYRFRQIFSFHRNQHDRWSKTDYNCTNVDLFEISFTFLQNIIFI